MPLARLPELLFHTGGSLSSHLDKVLRQAVAKADQLPAAEILAPPIEHVVDRLTDEFLPVPPVLDLANAHLRGDPREVQLDRTPFDFIGNQRLVDAMETVIVVPIVGSPELLLFEPSASSSYKPRGVVELQTLYVKYIVPADEIDGVPQAWARDRIALEEFTVAVGRDVQAAAPEWKRRLELAIGERRNRLLKSRGVAGALGLPVRRTGDTATTFSPPEIRRRLPPLAAPQRAGEIVPALTEEIFDHIVSLIERAGDAMQRSPRFFREAQEPVIRDIILVMLNTHYESQATGETFNFNGKTDIYLRVSGKDVFVAECKFWSGPKAYLEAIDQLLGYTTWRDSKAAVVLFNKNRDHTAALRIVQEITPQHRSFRIALAPRGETHFRFVFAHPQDAERDLYLAVLAIAVPPASEP